MKKDKRTHLYIVKNKSSDAMSNSIRREPIQLSLQLDRSENLIACIGETYLTGDLLSHLLRTLQPHYLLDLRICPRFDMFGYSRKKAFADFERWGARYFSLTTEEAEGDIENRVQRLIAKLSRDSSSLIGPLVVLVETTEAIDKISHAMPKSICKSGKWSISVEGIPTTKKSTNALHTV